jgi:hypothetical protein
VVFGRVEQSRVEYVGGGGSRNWRVQRVRFFGDQYNDDTSPRLSVGTGQIQMQRLRVETRAVGRGGKCADSQTCARNKAGGGVGAVVTEIESVCGNSGPIIPCLQGSEPGSLEPIPSVEFFSFRVCFVLEERIGEFVQSIALE